MSPHGSLRKIKEYLFEDRDGKGLLRNMEQVDADIMCFGHTHKPYHRILPSEPTENIHYRHAINIGSVGKPKDGNPKGCYMMLTINPDSRIINRDAFRVEVICFDYDIDKAAKAVEDRGLTKEYADMLRRGYLIITTSDGCSEKEKLFPLNYYKGFVFTLQFLY